jgi:hypothetical protein
MCSTDIAAFTPFMAVVADAMPVLQPADAKMVKAGAT